MGGGGKVRGCQGSVTERVMFGVGTTVAIDRLHREGRGESVCSGKCQQGEPRDSGLALHTCGLQV